MVKCLIVDDEPLALQVLESYILKTEGMQLVKKCLNALEAFESLHSSDIDLLFLDIKMPGMSGIDFIRSLKKPPAFIFTTAFSEFAVLSYELEAVDYLLKPITYERFNAAMAKYLKINAEPEAKKTYSYFKVNGKMVKLEHDAIIYAQSVKDYVTLYTTTGKYMTHMTMTYLSGLLPEQNFRRVHRSYLVNTSYITAINSQKIELGTVIVPVGENYRSNTRGISD